MILKHLERGAFGNIFIVKRKSSEDCNYRVFAAKMTRRRRHSLEWEVFSQVVWHPCLVQLVSFFKTKVSGSYLNVTVFRQLLIMKFTMTVNM
jgi:hypothetical protein